MPDSTTYARVLGNAKFAFANEVTRLSVDLKAGEIVCFKKVNSWLQTIYSGDFAIAVQDYTSKTSLQVYECLSEIAGTTNGIANGNAQGVVKVNNAVIIPVAGGAKTIVLPSTDYPQTTVTDDGYTITVTLGADLAAKVGKVEPVDARVVTAGNISNILPRFTYDVSGNITTIVFDGGYMGAGYKVNLIA